jgi:hypothetical protein
MNNKSKKKEMITKKKKNLTEKWKKVCNILRDRKTCAPERREKKQKGEG